MFLSQRGIGNPFKACENAPDCLTFHALNLPVTGGKVKTRAGPVHAGFGDLLDLKQWSLVMRTASSDFFSSEVPTL